MFRGGRLRRHHRDRARGTAARDRSWHSTCFRNRQSAVVKCSRAQTRNVGRARLDGGDVTDDGGCHGESDRVLHSRLFSENS